MPTPTVTRTFRITVSPQRRLVVTMLSRQRTKASPVQFRALGAYQDDRKKVLERAIPVAGAWREDEKDAVRSLGVDLEQSGLKPAATALEVQTGDGMRFPEPVA
ncbi:hypothetical protein DOMOVOI_00420 [Brevundimonas phage vB_BpoS-Domovoi]|uniref:Uncharacterized protein n=1 Tax=Brevundimonas phage vB_BpoS-Domovoi TaxID=2948598 RepID=A0A9E7SM67_9CAUD|nr:hypothetical protein DOMOVOI_00420 [Brevundimonas phage vB_BpoS-Domovoi]